MGRCITSPQLTKLTLKVDLEVKKNTEIDQLLRSEEKFKPLGVGKYNITVDHLT